MWLLVLRCIFSKLYMLTHRLSTGDHWPIMCECKHSRSTSLCPRIYYTSSCWSIRRSRIPFFSTSTLLENGHLDVKPFDRRSWRSSFSRRNVTYPTTTFELRHQKGDVRDWRRDWKHVRRWRCEKGSVETVHLPKSLDDSRSTPSIWTKANLHHC